MARFRDGVEPILIDYCYRCHAEGTKKGGFAFDGFASDEAMLANRTFWWTVLKNVRSGVMPPAKKPRPSPEDVRVIEDWVKRDVFDIDLSDPDPGRVTIRRLNRVEYHNTIHDLMGIDFPADEEFPPDDTGYGFDNIGDVLTVSPLLLEKYMKAAEAIVAEAVPTVSAVMPTRTFSGSEFRAADGKGNGDKMSFYKPATVSHSWRPRIDGTYRLLVDLNVRGAFDFDPGRCRLVFKAGDRELLSEEFKWEDGRRHHYEFPGKWEAGDHRLTFALEPLSKPEEMKTSVDMRIASVVVEGPLEREHWTRPRSFDRFFTADDPGTTPERRRYAREVLSRFAGKAYRRPIDDRNLDRLVALAETVFTQPGKSVESGVAEAMVAILSSPRFLFRVEGAITETPGERYSLVDEYALASRLSYFLWSTMPDDELFALAARGELRKNLSAQFDRMMADPRSDTLIENFVGQWLQARDIEGVAIDAREVLARDSGDEKDLKREQEEFRALLVAA